MRLRSLARLLGLILAAGSVGGVLIGVLPVRALAQAPPPECLWEWGGVEELIPAPCPTPVPVSTPSGPVGVEVQGQPVAVTTPSGPVGVEVQGQPVAVTVPTPVPVVEQSPESDTSGSAAAEVAGLRDEVVLGLGLLIFLLAVTVVWQFAARHRSA